MCFNLHLLKLYFNDVQNNELKNDFELKIYN